MAASNDWLPPGWTEEKLRTATDAEYDALTQEQYDRIMGHHVEHDPIVTAQNEAFFGTNTATAQAVDPNHPLANTNAFGGAGIEANIAQELHRTGYRELGFVVFRIRDGASTRDDAHWERFKQTLSMIANDGRTRDPADVATATVDKHGRPWPTWGWVDDDTDDLRTLDVDALRARFDVLRSSGAIGPGLDTGIALAVTAEALASFAETTTTLADEEQEFSGPWVYAVDTQHHEEAVFGDDGEGPLKGFFKTAAAFLLVELWTVLSSQAQRPEELEAAVWEGRVWEGLGQF